MTYVQSKTKCSSKVTQNTNSDDIASACQRNQLYSPIVTICVTVCNPHSSKAKHRLTWVTAQNSQTMPTGWHMPHTPMMHQQVYLPRYTDHPKL